MYRMWVIKERLGVRECIIRLWMQLYTYMFVRIEHDSISVNIHVYASDLYMYRIG